MQLDVAQQVPLLGEGGAALVTLKRTLTYNHKRQKFRTNVYCWVLSLILWAPLLTRVAPLVDHQYVGSDANHATHLALKFPIGQPDGARRGRVGSSELVVNAPSLSPGSRKCSVPFSHGVPSVIFRTLSSLSLLVVLLWSA